MKTNTHFPRWLVTTERTGRCLSALRLPTAGLSALSLVALTLWAFAPSLQFGFVNWDDPSTVINNELITNWSPANLYGIATETVTRNYAPLTVFTLLIDHTLWGLDPAGYHATNLLLHTINGLLVFVLIRNLTGSPMTGWMTAALFLVHPVQIESVAWIASRKGLLCATLMLAAMGIRLRPEVGPKHDGWYIGLLAAALLSKALAVVLPPIVLLYDVLVRREKVSDAVVRQVIPGLLALLLLLITMGAQNSILGGVRSHMQLGLASIVAVDVTILWRYLFMLFRPTELCVLYDPPTTGIAWQVLAGSAGFLLIGTVLWRNRQRHPLWILGAASFLCLLFPVLNFFPITSLMNDRYLYLPSVIIFAMVAGALERSGLLLSERLQLAGAQKLPLVAAGAALAGCLIIVRAHLPVWQDSDSLWAHTMQKVPQLPVVRIQLALTLRDSGRTSDALRVMRQALVECQPDELDRVRMQRAIEEWSVSEQASSRERTLHAPRQNSPMRTGRHTAG